MLYNFGIFPMTSFIDLVMYQYGHEQCTPGHIFGPAARNHFVFHYVVSGTGKLYSEDTEGNDLECTVRTGEGFLLIPGQVTTYVADKRLPWEYMWIEFDGLRVKELLEMAEQAVRDDNARFGLDTQFQSCRGAGSESGRDREMDENLPNPPENMRTSGNVPESAVREDLPAPEPREEISSSRVTEKKNIDIDIIMSPFLNLSLYQAGYPLISDIRFLSEERDYEDVTLKFSHEKHGSGRQDPVIPLRTGTGRSFRRLRFC